MKQIIKVPNMRSTKDVSNIRSALSSREGVIACQIKKDNKEIDIVYDNYFIKLDDIYNLLEDMGYTVL
ncbi:ferredoxin [Clostridium aestuarii]|uniref:Ferredoxin n=1 Tax=Clostridium aestuarii TaxID=338193 RepID=A0ABT4D0L2_9CLOT|nr:ferredoxin [Clostridium aestuarii]MCY6484783.1 ferredoxin [Clostridium aestuarii]